MLHEVGVSTRLLNRRHQPEKQIAHASLPGFSLFTCLSKRSKEQLWSVSFVYKKVTTPMAPVFAVEMIKITAFRHPTDYSACNSIPFLLL